MFFVNKLTFKSAADQAQKLTELKVAVTALESKLKDEIAALERDGWTYEQRVQLESRLTRTDERLSRLIDEVDFTKTSHQEFLRLLERALIPVAHSPHTPELDALLDKRARGEDLTANEWQELLERLDQQASFYDDLPGKKVALKGLRAIYLAHLRAAQRKEGLLHNGSTA